MEVAMAADPKVSAEWYRKAKRYIGDGLFADYWEIKSHNITEVVAEVWDDMYLSPPGLKLKILGVLIYDYLEQYRFNAEQGGVIPSELDTPEAWGLWRKLQAGGMVDAHLQLKVSQNKGAIIADVVGNKLKLSPKWNAFEALWHIRNLANKRSQAQSKCIYFDDYRDKVVRALQ